MKFFLKCGLTIAATFLFSCASDADDYVDVDSVLTDEDIAILSESLNLPATSYNYANIQLPPYFLNNALANEDNTPGNNPITNSGATLGRVLFYDTKLSANNTISCASCHIQAEGFSDNRRLSVGFDGGLTGRNSMGLSNAKFYDNGRFFWDERAASLEEQTLMPIQDLVEMGMTLPDLEAKLSQEEYYSVLFSNAFGDPLVTSDRIALALSQFIRAMVSFQSEYDTGLAQVNNPNVNFPNFSDSENLGKNLFFSNRTRCSDCHTTNAFVGDRARNNGLDATITDPGVGGVTGENNRLGAFKVGSLRNISLTAPYMHDGRFASLEEVVEFYNSGVQDSPQLDNRLRRENGAVRLNLNEAEKQGLVDFLRTLTDPNFVSDVKYSDPFN